MRYAALILAGTLLHTVSGCGDGKEGTADIVDDYCEVVCRCAGGSQQCIDGCALEFVDAGATCFGALGDVVTCAEGLTCDQIMEGACENEMDATNDWCS